MKTMHASVCIDLPADEFEEAEVKLKVKPLWEAFLAGLRDALVTPTAKLETLETRAKPAAKRGRKPRLVSPPSPPPGEAA